MRLFFLFLLLGPLLMADRNPLLDLYGEGYQSPAVQNLLADPHNESGQAPTYSLAQALAAYRPHLADHLPTNRALPAPQFPFDPRSLSALNMIHGGVRSAQNWLERRPEVGPDTLAPLGLAGLGLPFAKAGAVGVFGGRLGAETLAERGVTGPQRALDLAERMAANGASRDDIRAATNALIERESPQFGGVHQGKEGDWRFEISDHNAQWRPNVGETFRDKLYHPQLAEAYPYVANLPVALDPVGGAARAQFDPIKGQIGIAYGPKTEQKTAALHEGQHGIGHVEGFAPGGDAAALADWDRYRRLAGEVEARNVETRQAMTPAERRATPPWKTQDIPDERQIVDWSPANSPQLSADSSRASLPGILVNGMEQGGKPTAGTTPLSPRAAAVDQGHRGMYELQGSPFERADGIISSPGPSLEHAQQTMDHVRQLQQGVTAGGEFGELAALQLKRMQRYGDIDAARRTIDAYHAGPRSQNYWRGLDAFDKAEVPLRALSQDEKGRFYDKNRMNVSPSSLPGTLLSHPSSPQDGNDLASLLERYGVR